MMRWLPLRSSPWLALLAALCGLAVGAPAVQAVCPDESGIGGTGIRGDDESGVGGTGLSGDDASGVGGTGVGDDEDESGIGGTGLRSAGTEPDGGSGVGGTGLGEDESGVGGTGLVGTITAYGSICVNGESVEFDESTPVEENGALARASDLTIGSVVVVDAERRNGVLHARRVAVRHAAMGPATRLDADGRTLEVVGQRVEVPRGARVVDRLREGADVELGDWVPGEYLAVSGLRQSDGRIVASRVERRAPRTEVSVTGRLESRDGALRVGGAAVELAERGDGDARDPQGPVLVRGRWNARASRIEGARAERAVRFEQGAERVSLEGYVQELDDDGRGRVGGLPVVIARDARGDRSPARGDRVRVSGRLDREGRLRAHDVRVDRSWRDRLDRDDRRERRDRKGRAAAAGRLGRDRDDDDRDDDERDGDERDRDDDREKDDDRDKDRDDDDRDRDERDRDERDRDERDDLDRDDRDRDERERDRDDREGDDDDDRDRDERDEPDEDDD